MATLHDTLTKYDVFLNTKLKPNLTTALQARDALLDTKHDYEMLAEQIDMIKQENHKQLKTMVDLGSQFYVQANVPDTTFIFVQVGFGFHVQFTLDEAKNYIGKKVQRLQRDADKYTQEANKIRAHIQMVLEAMAEVLNKD